MQPPVASIYAVGAGLLAVFGLVAWAVLAAPQGDLNLLTSAAKDCGFADPRFTRRGEVYRINETLVNGPPNPPVPAEGQRLFERSKLLQTKLMPCLEQAAKPIGVRVGYEKTVMIN